MNINTVNNGVLKNVRKDRVGRGPGSGNGKTAGRGMNGQRSRAGFSTSPVFEGGQLPLARRIPKRGFNNKVFADVVESVSLKTIVYKFDGSVEITPELLEEKKLISSAKSIVKLIGSEELTVAYKFKVHRVSEGAKAAVEKAGGSVEILPGKKPVVKNKMKSKAKAA
ncbi:MAG: 50S ribosomal protein L15 [Thermoguttaceae bacterium]|nr:50S ribosomal protein L15 [Thermoguttaceae bacterium]MBR5757395.1 50S ribosomal protein L15 [Thermoguttaceae bacterium]